ncbi:MAG: 4'-phosphopantetheinyl transferase superfamily protein [Acidobacteria bacterium]|nr:4'-phosphopantetheinyl transferase superfamily protein [Acidobacteriota bacterium]
MKSPGADVWAHPSASIKLGEDEAHVWRASLNQEAEIIGSLATLLSPDEYQRAEKYRRLIDRDRFIAGRGILRKIISVYLAISPAELQFTYNEYGKPTVSDDQNDCALNFNLSHSNGMALYAVACRRRVGVDIEYIRKDFTTLDIAEPLFSKDEVRSLKTIPADLRTEAFFNCWSRKESYIKAIGMGVSYPLDGFTVSIAPNVAPSLLKVDSDECEPYRWQMYELKAREGYAASSIVENPPVTLRQWSADF